MRDVDFFPILQHPYDMFRYALATYYGILHHSLANNTYVWDV